MLTWQVVGAKLREVIDAEDKLKPLTDEDIRQAMSNLGINVARRTVTKQRQLLNIRTWRGRRTRSAS